MGAHGGLITEADLAAVRSRRVEPLRVPYRGRTLVLPPPPAGGIFVAEVLRILERFDLPPMGHNSPAMIAILAEALKIAGLDKDRHVGDPDFVAIPLDRLLSDAYADDCAARIRAGERASLARAGNEPKGTTTISCVDADGLVVSMTHTLGMPSGVIPPGLGFMLNGAMNWYDPRPGRATSIAPGKRRFSSMSPLIVMEADAPVATLGAPGGAWIGVALAQVLVKLLDFGMGLQEAVMAPRISVTSETLDLSLRIPRATEAALAAVPVPANPPTTLCVSVVSGGTSINAIANAVTIEVDFRSASAAELAKLDAAFLAIVERAVATENAARSTCAGVITAEIARVGNRPAGETPAGSPIREIAAAAVAAGGYQPSFEFSSTDANVPMSLGIPARKIGAGGRGGRAHSLDEWLDVEPAECLRGMRSSLAIILALVGMEGIG